MPLFFCSWSLACSTWVFALLLSTPAWSVTRPETPNGGSARAGPPAASSRTADRPRTTESRRTLEPPLEHGRLHQTPGLYARAGGPESSRVAEWEGAGSAPLPLRSGRELVPDRAAQGLL